MGGFNSEDHYIYYCGQESLRRNGVALIVNKRVQNSVPECNLKNDRTTSAHFQDKPFNITVIQVYAPTRNAEEVERFCEDLQDLLELTPQKMSFSLQGTGMQKQEVKSYLEQQANLALEYRMKEGKGGKREMVLSRECTGHSKHPLQTTQEKSLHMDITRWLTLYDSTYITHLGS